MAAITNGQTCLESRGYTERHREIAKNKYTRRDDSEDSVYSEYTKMMVDAEYALQSDFEIS